MRPPGGLHAAVLAAGLLGAGACAPRGDALTVYAAASLREVCAELGRLWEASGESPAVFQLGASGDLARQILLAGKADVFLSADELELARLEEARLVAPGTNRDLLANRLVVIVPADSPLTAEGFEPERLAELERVALGNPGFVPAGRYARAWLEAQGLWARVEPRVLPALDVRAALAAVEGGSADAGIVYATDAARSRSVKVVLAVEGRGAPRIVYPVCALAGPRLDAALRFLALCETPEARAVFERAGFGVIGAAEASGVGER